MNISVSSLSNDLTAAHFDALWSVASNKPRNIIIIIIIITPAYVKLLVSESKQNLTQANFGVMVAVPCFT
jgi:hypothetical protein